MDDADRSEDEDGAASDPNAAFEALKNQLGRLEGLIKLPGRAMSEVEDRLVPAWRRRTKGEPRWGVSIAVGVVVALQLSLPPSLEFPPRWLLPVVGSVLLAGLLIANPRSVDRRSTGIHATSILLTGIMSLANAVSAGRLIHSLLDGRAASDAGLLLRWGGTIWVANIVVFALWYWDLDRGGPASRALALREHPDLLFPQMANPETAPADWQPEFVDYLYLSFTTSTAFSPTDVLPLARWAKMTMMLQTMVSIATVVLVVARAVNVLGT